MNIRLNYDPLLYNDKLDQVIRIALITDVHFTKHFDTNLLNKICEILSSVTPDYICIAGDLLNDASIVDDLEAKKIILEWLGNLSKIANVIISLGNHDIMTLQENKWHLKINEKWFENISNLDKVILLRDNQFKHDETCLPITFYGFNPSVKWYEEDNEYIEQFISEFRSTFKDETIDKRRLNILLSHSPNGLIDNGRLISSEELGLNEEMDFILSGHMHGGLLPKCFEPFMNHKGIIGPHGIFLPSNAYGKYENYEGTELVISRGITKLSGHLSYSSLVNPLYTPDIDILEIINKRVLSQRIGKILKLEQK